MDQKRLFSLTGSADRSLHTFNALTGYMQMFLITRLSWKSKELHHASRPLNWAQQNQGAVPLRENSKGEEEEEKEQEEGHGEEGGREKEAWRREEILSSFSWGDSAGERVLQRQEGNF